MSMFDKKLISLRGILGIYCITNISQNKRYIGSTKNVGKRLGEHKSRLKGNYHPNIHLQRSWNKYGESAFDFDILEKVEDLDILISREQYWIDTFNSANDNFGYNICPQANKTEMSEETKTKISNTKRGIPMKESTKRKLSISNTGHITSEETKKKLSAAFSGKNNPIYGRKRTVEEKLKMSENRKGIVAWNKGIPCNEKLKLILRNKRLESPNPRDPNTGKFLKGISPYLPPGENSIK